MSLENFVQVRTAYTRSVNLERDSGGKGTESTYIPTTRALRTFATIADRFTESDQPRSWSLVGPYGSGKSSFALFLSELLGSPDAERTRAAMSQLKGSDSELVSRFAQETGASDGYVSVLVSGTPERLSLRYLDGLMTAVGEYWIGRRGKKPQIFQKMRSLREAGNVSISELLALTQECQQALSRVGCPGLLIVFDEFGKFLEFESHTPDANDVFLLQALAEHAYTAQRTRLLVIALLHQSIEQYAHGVGETLKNEWAKIQGRFEEIPFIETAEQTLRVVDAALVQDGIEPKLRNRISEDASAASAVLQKEGVLTDLLDTKESSELFAGLYPLHPVSAIILPYLCQLISQNERSLFGYLGSREPDGFQDMLKRLAKPGDYIRPDHLFDYFLANQQTIYGDYLTQRRWAESVSAVERVADVTERQMAILKAVALINLLGNRGRIRASEALLQSVYGPSAKSELEKLRKASVLIHRKFNNEYRVWQGSDFDLESQLREETNQLGPFSLAEELTRYKAVAPIVARKYSIEKGALRYFSVQFVDALTWENVESTGSPQIFLYLSAGRDDTHLYNERARKHLAPLGLVAVSHAGQALKALVAERLALEAIERTAKELSDDPVARKELGTRLDTVRQFEASHISQMLDHPQNLDWWFGARRVPIASRRQFQSQLSSVLEKIYPYSPEIHNELINRDKLSSQAAAARNRLLSLLLTNVDKEDLGVDPKKFPPEKAIYRATLRETGIHRESKGNWKLCKPPKGSSLSHAWRRVEEFLATTETTETTEKKARPFTDINSELMNKPYGVKAGVLPILWVCVYLVYEYEIALYEEGHYIPGFSTEALERFVKRPDKFQVQRFRIEGVKESIFEQYRIAIEDGAPSSSILEIAKSIARAMRNLPEYTQRTRTGLSAQALAVREAFNLAKSPNELLFDGLLKALNYKERGGGPDQRMDGFSEQLKRVLQELKSAHSQMKSALRQRFAETVGLNPKLALQDLRAQSRGRCHGLENQTVDVHGLRGLLLRISREGDSDEKWFENILMFLANKPSTKWTDADRNEAEYKLAQFARRLADLYRLAAEERRIKLDGDQEFDVYLLKSLKSGGQFLDEVVTIDQEKQEHAEKIKREIEAALEKSGSRDLQLAALAQVVDDFLRKSSNQPSNLIESDEDEQGVRLVHEQNR